MTTPVLSSHAGPVLSELTQQLHRFFHQLDEGRYEAMLAQFTDDGRWLRQGKWLEGREQIGATLAARPAGVATRHVMSNGYITELSADRAVLEAYMTAYRYPAGRAATADAPRIAGPLRLNLVSTVFRRDAGHDWRIAEQRMTAEIAFAE
jgi:hypothetical protein